jgi:hypothetical protein
MARVNPNKYVTPEIAEIARKIYCIRLQDACRLWGRLHYDGMGLEALRGNLEGCVMPRLTLVREIADNPGITWGIEWRMEKM